MSLSTELLLFVSYALYRLTSSGPSEVATFGNNVVSQQLGLLGGMLAWSRGGRPGGINLQAVCLEVVAREVEGRILVI